jgi:hypothetical protein
MWENVEAENEQEPIDKILFEDPLFDDFAKHYEDPYRVVAEQVGEEEGEEDA